MGCDNCRKLKVVIRWYAECLWQSLDVLQEEVKIKSYPKYNKNAIAEIGLSFKSVELELKTMTNRR